MSTTLEGCHDLATLVRLAARKYGPRVAVRFPQRTLTYETLDSGSDTVAWHLGELGIVPGDRVASLLPNQPEFLLLLFGCAKRGAVFVPLNSALRGELLDYELDDCAPKLLVWNPNASKGPTRRGGKRPAPTVWQTEPLAATTPGVRAEERFPRWDGRAVSPSEFAPSPWDPAEILYTSGTTGPPKAAVLPHERLVHTPSEIGRRADLTPGSVLLTALPLFHCNALEKTTLPALLNGLTAVLLDRFHASTFWEDARAAQASHVSLLTTMITVLYKQPPRASDRSHGVRVATTSGTPAALWRSFEERFGLKIIESYGMTECGCTTLMNPPGAVRPGSVGTPLDFVEARIVDAFDRAVPDRQVGELVVRPRRPFTMFLEYYRKPEATVEAWRNLWFHTGDLLWRDEAGYYHFVDRQKDVIRRRGENIAPYVVEQALEEHPAVLEAVAVGVPSELGEDEIKAWVRLRPNRRPDPEEILRFAGERLPALMVPRYVEFIDLIPKTANEKAQRRALRTPLTGREYDRLRADRPSESSGSEGGRS